MDRPGLTTWCRSPEAQGYFLIFLRWGPPDKG
jgi:hypothetical protein